MIIIEHLEEVVSPWLYYEYKHSAEVCEDLLITNVRDESERLILSEICDTISISIKKLPFRKIIVLDPLADVTLRPEDFEDAVVVVGGILGDHPPQGRTRKYLSSVLNCEIRNLGKIQMSIDSAVYVAIQISKGVKFEDLKFVDGLEIAIDDVRTVELPYRYPIVESKPFISEELVEYIKNEMDYDYRISLLTGRPVSISDKFRRRLSLH